MRKDHLENNEDNSSDEDYIRNTEIVIEKAGKQVKRNFPFALEWGQQAQRRNTGDKVNQSQKNTDRHPKRKVMIDKERVLFDENNMV